MRWIGLLFSIFLLAFCMTAQAWDGQKAGPPGLIEITHGGNYAFRVYISGVEKICDNAAAGFVYLEPQDSNYSAYVAMILMAKSQGTTLTFYGNLDGSGYCRLGHLAMP
jgi:hypothetical protein